MGVEYEYLKAVFEADTAQAERSVMSLMAKYDQLEAKLKNFNGGEGFGNKISGGAGKATGSISLLNIAAGNLIGNITGRLLSATEQAGAALLEYSSYIEQARINWERLEGSLEKGNQRLAEIRQFANQTPFTFEGLLPLAQRLRDANIAGEELLPTLKDIGNAVASGASNKGESLDQRLTRVSVAIKQILDKGKLSAEEVNQLAESGIPAWRMLSEELGKTKGEIISLAEKGQISSELFLAAFRRFSQQNYGDAMEKQSRTFAGATSTIQDALMSTASKSFEPLYGKISEITVRVSKVAQDKQEFEGVGQAIAEGIGEGLAAGMELAAYAVIERFKNRFSQVLKGEKFFNPTDPSGFFTDALMSYYKGAFRGATGMTPLELQRGINFAIGGTGEITAGDKIKNQFAPTIAAVNNQLRDMKANAPSPEELFQANQLKLNGEKVAKVIEDLTNDISFYGLKTEEASVRQKLLKDGITELNTEGAKSAIWLARQIDAMRRAEEINDVINDLTQQIVYFGDETEQAAVKQKLWEQGIYDFSDASVQMALGLAAQIDKLKEAKDQADKYDEGLKKAREEMGQMRDSAFQDFLNPDATPLEKFNFWVSRNAKQFSELETEIEFTRQTLELLDKQMKQREAWEFGMKVVGSFEDRVRALRNELDKTSELNRDLQDIGKELNLAVGPEFKKGVRPDFVDILDDYKDFADKVEGFYKKIEDARAVRDSAPDGSRAREIADLEVTKQKLLAIKGLAQLGRWDEKDGVVPLFKGIQGDLDERAWDQLEKLFDLREKLRNQDSGEKYKKLLTDLNEQMMIGTAETNAYRIAKELEGDAYRNLTDKQKENLKLRAAEVDAYLKSPQYQIDSERFRLNEQFRESQAAIAVAAETAAERYRNAWQDAINEIALADYEASESLIRSQVLMDDKFTIHADQIRARIGETLADAPGLTEIFSDIGVDSIESSFEGVNTAIDAFIGKLGIADTAFGNLVESILSDLARLALSKFFTWIIGSLAGGIGGGGSSSLFGGGGGTSFESSIGGWFASGGQFSPTDSAKAFIAGEHGRELVVPGGNAYIFSNSDTESILSGNKGRKRGGNTIIINNNQTINAPCGTIAPKSRRQIAEQAANGMGRALKRID